MKVAATAAAVLLDFPEQGTHPPCPPHTLPWVKVWLLLLLLLFCFCFVCRVTALVLSIAHPSTYHRLSVGYFILASTKYRPREQNCTKVFRHLDSPCTTIVVVVVAGDISRFKQTQHKTKPLNTECKCIHSQKRPVKNKTYGGHFNL